MTFDEALAWLDSLESLGIQPGLERITALLERLGNPHLDFPAVLIAGTNGKGSVAAFLSAILHESAIEAGVYTSPHLVHFQERIRIGGALIAPDELADLAGRVREAVGMLRRDGGAMPTYFEATTALAFLHFSRRRVPIAVLEVGMGGRYDATNVVRPLACAITPIALDHTQWLGATVAEIAWQKAGILKAGVPAVVARQTPPAMEVIRAEAARIGAPLIESSACVVTREAIGDPPRFSLRTQEGRRFDDIAPALRGEHQVENATVALLLSTTLRGVTDDAILRGVARADWPGRLQLLVDPLGDRGADLLLDGAHNPAGCVALADYLARYQAKRRRRVLLFAALRDKAASEMLATLAPVVDEIILTSLPMARGTPAAELLRLAVEGGRVVRAEPDPGEALQRALRSAGPGGLAIASGSLYLVGEILRRLRV